MVAAGRASDAPMRTRWALSLVLSCLTLQVHAQEEGADELGAPEFAELDEAETDQAEADADDASDERADEARDGDAALALEVHAGTAAPLDVFVGANVVLGERLLLTTSIGVSAYRRAIDSVALRFGGEESAEIVTPLLFGATVVRLGVGLRLFGNGGPEVLAGYSRIMGSATWDAGSFGIPARFGEISASVGINAVYAELGWAISIGNAFIRPAIGFTRALGTRISVSAEDANEAQTEVASEAAREAVDGALDDFGMTPTLSLSIGGRFEFSR